MALPLAVAWHVLLAAATLAASHGLAQKSPELVIHEIRFVQAPADPAVLSSALPVPTALPPSPTSPVQPPAAILKARQPAPASKAVPAPPNPASRPQPPAVERISEAVSVVDGAERGEAASLSASPGPAVDEAAAVPATAPGYHMGSLSTPSPDYPHSARKRRREGQVLIGLDVGADGRVTQAMVLESSGDAALDEAARNTLERWQLRPATEGGRPVAGRVEVPVRFQLR